MKREVKRVGKGRKLSCCCVCDQMSEGLALSWLFGISGHIFLFLGVGF